MSTWRDDLFVAARFLTRARIAGPHRPVADAARAFPLIGLGVGIIGALVYHLAAWLGLSGFLAALAAVTATILATGALHEDGLADTADGLGGGRDRAHALAIMRDSRTGAYGALALVLSVAARTGALASAAAPGWALLGAHGFSRALLPSILQRLEPARADGLGATAGKPRTEDVWWSLGLGALFAFIGLGLWGGLVGITLACAAVATLAGVARRRLGGYTGDILGAAQQLAEISLLVVASAL
jgi:adenosylcobinamide-GDP ribazoletransferase